jgi:hypothetical protein
MVSELFVLKLVLLILVLVVIMRLDKNHLAEIVRDIISYIKDNLNKPPFL